MPASTAAHYRIKQVPTFFGVTLESLTFFGVSMEYFGVLNQLFDHFVLLSFQSYGGIPSIRLGR
jgi:hypothetical protein